MTSTTTTINTTPVSAAIFTQNGLSVSNSPVSSISLSSSSSQLSTMPSVVATSMTITPNSVSPAKNGNLLQLDNAQVLTKQRLQDLVREVDPNVQTDEDVEDLLMQLAEDFIYDVVDTSCKLAKHRGMNSLEVKDVQLSLEKSWNMWIPGFGGEELRTYKKSATTDAHRQRLNLIKRAKK